MLFIFHILIRKSNIYFSFYFNFLKCTFSVPFEIANPITFPDLSSSNLHSMNSIPFKQNSVVEYGMKLNS